MVANIKYLQSSRISNHNINNKQTQFKTRITFIKFSSFRSKHKKNAIKLIAHVNIGRRMVRIDFICRTLPVKLIFVALTFSYAVLVIFC